jgi:hypothetical protein
MGGLSQQADRLWPLADPGGTMPGTICIRPAQIRDGELADQESLADA